MSLRPGTLLGTYEVIAQIGTGGMGEVYKARDPKLDRLVAIKVLPTDLAANPDFLGRFQREARAIAALNHPALLGIFDFGQEGGHVFAVMELLEGETLRACLARGPLPVRRAIELGVQMAQGMAAAHEKGIIHRDLKPDNLWITREGRFKILDFGLAKQAPALGKAGGHPETEALSLGPRTELGMILGTMGYMSPEQVRGEAVDPRSDIFAFGVVLYEMLSGQRAFKGDTPIQTMNAILESDPEELRVPKGTLPPALERLVMHCLEKRPENRFQSMRDLAYDLGNVTSAVTSASFMAPFAARNRKTTEGWAALGAVLLLGAGFLGWRLQGRAPAPPLYTPLTFSSAPVWNARFTQDGASVVFTRGGALVTDTTIQILSFDNPMPRPVLGRNSALAGLSRTNELATLTGLAHAQGRSETFLGTLGRSPLAGANPRAISPRVVAADWSPDGQKLAVVRDEGPAGMRLEYPEGTVLARAEGGWFSHLRFSPDGERLAVLKHPVYGDDMGSVLVLELPSGKGRESTGPWAGIRGLAWRRDGREIWFTAGQTVNRELKAVDLHGKVRPIASAPADLNLEDIAADGRVLMTSGDTMLRVVTHATGSGETQDLTIKSYSTVKSTSLDGTQVIIDDETLEGPGYPMYLCTAGGDMPTALGIGLTASVAPGGQRIFILRGDPKAPKGVMLSLDNGQEQSFQMGRLGYIPNGLQVTRAGEVLMLQVEAAGSRLWKVSADQPPVPVGPPLPSDVTTFSVLDPAGRRALLTRLEGAVSWVDLGEAAGPVHPVSGLGRKDQVVGASLDGAWVFATTSQDLPLAIDRVNVATGKREPLLKLDLPGVNGRRATGLLCADGKRWVGTLREVTSQLFLVEGLN